LSAETNVDDRLDQKAKVISERADWCLSFPRKTEKVDIQTSDDEYSVQYQRQYDYSTSNRKVN